MSTTETEKQSGRRVNHKYPYREQWLNEALRRFIRQHFRAAGYEVPDNIRIGVGWPSRGALSRKKRVIGQAWSDTCSGDQSHEIIISLYLDNPIQVLGVLIHEVIHVTVGVQHGHKKPFTDCMKAVGLTGQATATTESEELKGVLAEWVKVLGPYPHVKLDGTNQPKQGTRLIKLECGGCGCIVRTTNKWLEEYGEEWPCPCGETLVVA